MASKKSATSHIHINVISNNINTDKPIQPNPDSHQSHYKTQPLCTNPSNVNTNPTKSLSSTSLRRLLHNLQPSQQEKLIKEKLTTKINKTNPKQPHLTANRTRILLSKLNRTEILNLLYDENALIRKINQIDSPPSTPPPSSSSSNTTNPTTLTVIKNTKTKIKSKSKPSPLPKCAQTIKTINNININHDWRAKYMELESKYNQIKTENIKLKCELKISSWKWFDIYDWILSLNNHYFQPYAQTLYDNLKAQDIDGLCLQILNKNDWKKLGVSSLECTKVLLKEIDQLFVPSNQENKEEMKENINVAVHAHVHALLSETKVCKMKIIDRKCVYIVGLSSVMCSNEYLTSMFGRFGAIKKNGIIFDSTFVSIYFEHEQSVLQVMDYVNNKLVLVDGKVCKARFGYTFYCPYWRKFAKCFDVECKCIHYWCDEKEIMSDEMMESFAQKPVGFKNKMSNTMQVALLPNIVITPQAIAQQMKINSLQQDLQIMRAQATDAVTTLTKQLDEKKKQWDVVVTGYKRLQSEYEALQVKYCVLDIKCSNLLGINNAENNEINNNYMEWDFNGVYLWIGSLHNGYLIEKYKMVYDNLKIEEIDGKCLPKLDKNDIHRIGITGYRDKLFLMENIKKLINNANI